MDNNILHVGTILKDSLVHARFRSRVLLRTEIMFSNSFKVDQNYNLTRDLDQKGNFEKNVKDPKIKNTQKYVRHGLALLRSGY